MSTPTQRPLLIKESQTYQSAHRFLSRYADSSMSRSLGVLEELERFFFFFSGKSAVLWGPANHSELFKL